MMLTRNGVIRGLFFLMVFMLQSLAYATEQPSEEQLADTSQLIVMASVEQVAVPEDQAVQGRGRVIVRIEKIFKWEYSKNGLIFSHSFGGRGEGDMTKEAWQQHWNGLKSHQTKLKLYLLDASTDPRYKDTGIEGLILVDEWFGYEVQS
jgi:hypothetical protein